MSADNLLCFVGLGLYQVSGRLEFNLSTSAANHNPLDVVAGKSFAFAGTSVLTITTSGGVSSGVYTLVTAPGGMSGSAPATLNLPSGWTASVSRSGNDLILTISTSTAPTYTNWQTMNGTWTTETLGVNVIITGSAVKYTFPTPWEIAASSGSASPLDENHPNSFCSACCCLVRRWSSCRRRG